MGTQIKYLSKDQIKALKEQASQVCDIVSVESVLASNNIPFKKYPSAIQFSCPSCGRGVKDLSAGINLTKPHLYHCFRCGEGGNALQLSSYYSGRELKEIIADEAYLKGVINAEEYDFLCRLYEGKGGKPRERVERTKDFVPTELPKQVENKLRSPAVLNLVYSAMMEMDAFFLTKDAISYLKGRGVTTYTDFFCYNKPFKVSKLVEKIQKKHADFNEDVLWGVPGFYFQFTDKEKTVGYWKFKNPQPDSLGLLIRNALGEIVGLQVRNMKKAHSRYYWISSANMSANEEKNTDFGSSPGCPPHVLYPQAITCGSYAFTEGVFKIKTLVDEIGGVGISLQGMTNSRDVAKEVSKSFTSPILQNRLKQKGMKLSFDFYFDADMIAKVQVYEAAKTCYESLHESRPQTKCYFHIWAMHHGKGFDDLVINHPDSWREKIISLTPEEFISRMEQQIAITKDLEPFRGKAMADIFNDETLHKAFQKALYQGFWMKLTYGV